MKPYFTLFLVGIASLSFAQNRSELTKTYDDNGVTLAISIKGTINGRSVDFAKSFDISDMDDDEKEELKLGILDSLGVIQAEREESDDESRNVRRHMVVANAGTQLILEAPEPDSAEPVAEPVYRQPFKKEIRMDSEKGELYMHYSFERQGEEYSFEKTVNITDKSDNDRLQIIADYERSINLPVRTIQ